MIRWRLILAAVLGALVALWLLNHTPLIAQASRSVATTQRADLSSVPDSLSVQAQVSAADHELEDGQFNLADGLAVIVDPEQQPAVYRYLVAHNGQRAVVTLREFRGVK